MKWRRVSKESVYLDAGGCLWQQGYVEFEIGQTYILNVRLADNYVLARCTWRGSHVLDDDRWCCRAYRFEIIEGEVAHHDA